MNEAEILTWIYGNLPEMNCEPGCVECCTVALWSPAEWAKLPPEFKGAGYGLAKVPMRGPRNTRMVALLPVKARELMSIASRPKLAVTVVVDTGILLTSYGLEGVRCPYAIAGEGCSVYEWRPFSCRIFGSSGEIGPMSCGKGIKPSFALPESIIMQRWLLWTNLLKPDHRYTAKKGAHSHDYQSIQP